MENDRLRKQIEFILEIDKVKSILRKSRLFDRSRFENDAEHSWHISIMALILSEYSNSRIDILKVIKMLLIHDIVEIDAGDVVVYDTKKRKENEKNEINAASRIFGLLPSDQKDEYFSLWQEFEKRETAEARFAAALDRMEPVMQNYYDEGYTWRKLGVTSDKVLSVNSRIKDGSEQLWQYIESLIIDAQKKGFFDSPHVQSQ